MRGRNASRGNARVGWNENQIDDGGEENDGRVACVGSSPRNESPEIAVAGVCVPTTTTSLSTNSKGENSGHNEDQ